MFWVDKSKPFDFTYGDLIDGGSRIGAYTSYNPKPLVQVEDGNHWLQNRFPYFAKTNFIRPFNSHVSSLFRFPSANTHRLQLKWTK